jgi:hypothetical protein
LTYSLIERNNTKGIEFFYLSCIVSRSSVMLLSFTKGFWVFGIVRNVITNITSYNANPHTNHCRGPLLAGIAIGAADPTLIRRSAADLKSKGIAASYIPPLFSSFHSVKQWRTLPREQNMPVSIEPVRFSKMMQSSTKSKFFPRAYNACSSCKHRKRKCDKELPNCSSCVRYTYRLYSRLDHSIIQSFSANLCRRKIKCDYSS